MTFANPTQKPPRLPCLAALALALGLAAALRADEDLNDFLNNSRPAQTAPAPASDPSAKAADPSATPSDTLPASPVAPARARLATVLLNDHTTLRGPVWTTRDTPFRLWIDARKTYQDVDLALVNRIEAKVVKEALEDDWRWLKEGSDQKVFSGKKYPAIELLYTFTLLNGQTLEGAVVAPLFLLDPATRKPRQLALYKQYKGKLGDPLSSLIYIRTLDFAPSPAAPTAAAATTTLPLLPDE